MNGILYCCKVACLQSGFPAKFRPEKIMCAQVSYCMNESMVFEWRIFLIGLPFVVAYGTRAITCVLHNTTQDNGRPETRDIFFMKQFILDEHGDKICCSHINQKRATDHLLYSVPTFKKRTVFFASN